MNSKNQTATKLYLNQADLIVQSYFKDKDGQPLKLVSYQLGFVVKVLSREHDRLICVAATQAGKSEQIACAIALLAILFPKERIVNVSYTDQQAKIIFERVKAHLIDDSDFLRSQVDLNRSLGKAKEFSRSRMFMKNGTEIRVLSTGTGETEKTGEGLLGFEATILVIDEAGSIPDEIYYTKILRMIGAKRTVGLKKMLILSGTPHTINHFETSWNDPAYVKFHVDWKKAVEAGRLDPQTVEEQKRKMTRIDFETWYEAKFPSMTEDSMFDMAEVERNIVSPDPTFSGIKILSVDVARFGVDKTVYTIFDYCNDIYRVVDIIENDHKDTMQVTGKIMALHNTMNFNRILVDETGLGGGVVDRLKEQGAPVSGVVAGGECTSPLAKKNCLNLKAELYAKAKRLFEQDKLKIIGRQELLHELKQMKRDYQSTGKLKIVDPSKSPDFCDSLIYGLYTPNTGAFIVLDLNKKDENQSGWR